MIVKNIISPCWFASAAELEDAADRAAAVLAGSPVPVFFRADDLGAPGENCRRMLDAFRNRGVPLHLAVTPAWLTPARWNVLRDWAGENDELWCWHQHGWRHLNHQTAGKKGEFGSDRTDAELRSDLTRGRDRLADLLGDAFRPVFTAPWNRFDARVGPILKELGFTAVSRASGENRKVPLPEGLPDVSINVDLHTRREPDPAEGLEHLIVEFKRAVDEGCVGVMLHHQRMNDAAFDFLDRCLEAAAGPGGPTLLRLDRV